MNRKDFLSICGSSCLGLIGLSVLTESCTSTYYIQRTISNHQIQLSKNDFQFSSGEKIKYRKYIIVKVDKADYPIVVYRKKENDYTALLMRCTHQGTELNVNGDLLTCPAHGAEFGNMGEPVQGPAEEHLKSFKITTDEQHIYIQMV